MKEDEEKNINKVEESSYEDIIKLSMEDNIITEKIRVFLSFKIEESWWVVDLEDISGTSLLNTISYIGRVQPWFLGISNFRGQVYPVINLQYFITGKDLKITMTKEIAILSSPKLGLNVALVIPEMDLMIARNSLIKIEDKIEIDNINKENKNIWVKEYWKNSEGKNYLELDLKKMIDSPEFLNIYKTNKVINK